MNETRLTLWVTVRNTRQPVVEWGRGSSYLDRLTRLLSLARSRGDRVAVILLQQRIRAESAR